MKKTAIILFLVLAIPALLTSCLFDEEDLFDKSASERIEAAKQEAKTVLESAENGWHVRYFPSPTQEFGGYNLFFKFSEGSVTVASEIESNPSITETSLYSLGEDLGVTLNFDTKNSLINYFVHPKNPDNIGSTYKGMEGDYKFTVMETSAAMVVLRGIITGNYYILTPVSADTDWSEDLETYRNNAEDMSFNTYSFVVKDKTYSATLTNRRFAVKIDSETTVYAPFIYTKAGISFYMPVEIDGVTAQNFTFVDDYYFAEVNGADFKIMTPEPVRSDITFEVTVPDATKTYNSVTVNTVPSTDTEYYYMGLMLKSEFEAQREKKLLQSLVGTLNGNIGAGDDPEAIAASLLQRCGHLYAQLSEFLRRVRSRRIRMRRLQRIHRLHHAHHVASGFDRRLALAGQYRSSLQEMAGQMESYEHHLAGKRSSRNIRGYRKTGHRQLVLHDPGLGHHDLRKQVRPAGILPGIL